MPWCSRALLRVGVELARVLVWHRAGDRKRWLCKAWFDSVCNYCAGGNARDRTVSVYLPADMLIGNRVEHVIVITTASAYVWEFAKHNQQWRLYSWDRRRRRTTSEAYDGVRIEENQSSWNDESVDVWLRRRIAEQFSREGETFVLNTSVESVAMLVKAKSKAYLDCLRSLCGQM